MSLYFFIRKEEKAWEKWRTILTIAECLLQTFLQVFHIHAYTLFLEENFVFFQTNDV